MEASFKVDCFKEPRLGTVLDPCKGSNESCVKILFSIVGENQSNDHQNVRIPWSSPGEAEPIRSNHFCKVVQTPMNSFLGYPDARVNFVPVKKGSSDDAVSMCICVCTAHIYIYEDTDLY